MRKIGEKLKNDGLIWEKLETKRFKNLKNVKKRKGLKFYTAPNKKRMRVF